MALVLKFTKKLLIAILVLNSNFCFASELKSIDLKEYYQQNPSKEKKLILNFITEQFKGKQVIGQQLDDAWNNIKLRKQQKLMRFQIIKQQLYAGSFDISHIYFVALFQYFQEFVKHYKIQDVDFIIHASDELLFKSDFPSFMMSKNLNSSFEKEKFLMPDAFLLSKNWKTLQKEIEDANLKNPWKLKVNKIFWRGATTGSKGKYLYNIDNFSKFARLKLIMFSKLYPNQIDARFTRFPEFSNDQNGQKLKLLLDLLFGKKNDFVKETEHLKYKYLIAIDGNTCPWLRVPWIMYSNSILIKQETDNIQWFYAAIKPYVHYVPLKEDLTDIFSQFLWMKEHDESLQEISKNAHNFIKNNLMPEDIDAHIAIILNEYSKIQQDKIISPSLTPSEDIFTIFSFVKLLLNRVKTSILGQ